MIGNALTQPRDIEGENYLYKNNCYTVKPAKLLVGHAAKRSPKWPKEAQHKTTLRDNWFVYLIA